MRTMIIAALLLSVAACGRPAEEAATAPSNTAEYTIVHTCAGGGKEIYRDKGNQGLMIWNSNGFWVELDREATIEGICGEETAASIDPSPITG